MAITSSKPMTYFDNDIKASGPPQNPTAVHADGADNRAAVSRSVESPAGDFELSALATQLRILQNHILLSPALNPHRYRPLLLPWKTVVQMLHVRLNSGQRIPLVLILLVCTAVKQMSLARLLCLAWMTFVQMLRVWPFSNLHKGNYLPYGIDAKGNSQTISTAEAKSGNWIGTNPKSITHGRRPHALQNYYIAGNWIGANPLRKRASGNWIGANPKGKTHGRRPLVLQNYYNAVQWIGASPLRKGICGSWLGANPKSNIKGHCPLASQKHTSHRQHHQHHHQHQQQQQQQQQLRTFPPPFGPFGIAPWAEVYKTWYEIFETWWKHPCVHMAASPIAVARSMADFSKAVQPRSRLGNYVPSKPRANHSSEDSRAAVSRTAEAQTVNWHLLSTRGHKTIDHTDARMMFAFTELFRSKLNGDRPVGRRRGRPQLKPGIIFEAF